MRRGVLGLAVLLLFAMGGSADVRITTRNGKDSDGHPLTALQHSYINAVAQAGGLPVMIPAILPEEDFLDLYSRLNGILFSGGGDVSLKYFNGSSHPRIGEVDDGRDTTEITLMRTAVQDGKPILGICRGAQVMNVALGGTLVQDVELRASSREHPTDRGWARWKEVERASLDDDPDVPAHPRHPMLVQPGSRLHEAIGVDEIDVNSFHHQAIDTVAPGDNARFRNDFPCHRTPGGSREFGSRRPPGPYHDGVADQRSRGLRRQGLQDNFERGGVRHTAVTLTVQELSLDTPGFGLSKKVHSARTLHANIKPMSRNCLIAGRR